MGFNSRHILAVTVCLYIIAGFAGFDSAALGAEQKIFDVTGQDPLDRVELGTLVDTKGKGKKFEGTGTVVLTDGREISVEVKLKYNAKKLKSSYKLKTPKKAVPKIAMLIKTEQDPEVVTKLTFSLKDVDKSKAKLKLKEPAQLPPVVSVDPDLSDQLVLESVRALMKGDDDFAKIIADLDDAVDADFRNTNPIFFRAIADFLRKSDDTLRSPTGDLNDLLTKAGFVEIGGTGFWDYYLDRADHMEGGIKDSTPSTDDGFDFVRNELVPALEALNTEFGKVPSDFEYRIKFLDAAEEFFDDDPADDTETIWIDAGDVHIMRAAVHVLLAFIDYVDAHEFDDILPDDFDSLDYPDRDYLKLFRDTYTEAGKLVRPAKLTSARTHIESAFQAYKTGATAILAETAEQRDNGLLTPYRGTLRGRPNYETIEQRDRRISDEASFRSWMQAVVDEFTTDAGYEFTTLPGRPPVKTERLTSVNLFEFWLGVDFRNLYFKTVVEPTTGNLVFGVTSLDELTNDMITVDGIIEKMRNGTRNAGDLMGGEKGLYALLVDSPPTSTKTVDGLLTDWTFGTNSVQIGANPATAYKAPRPDLGDLHLSRDAGNLYIAWTGGKTGAEVHLDMSIESATGYVTAATYGVAMGNIADPTVTTGVGGTEVQVPLSNFGMDEYVEITVSYWFAPDWDEARLGRIFVKVN